MRTPSPQRSDHLEEKIQEQAKKLQSAVPAYQQDTAGEWLSTLLQRINHDEDFRIAALRFIDVLPALENDKTLIKLYHEYFADIEFPLPVMGRLLKSVSEHLPEKILAQAIRKASLLLSQHFMGGETPEQLARCLTQLEKNGMQASLDMLGEISLSEHEAEDYAAAYIALLQSHPGTQPLHLSIKLSSLYPRMAAHNIKGILSGIMPRLCRLLDEARKHHAAVTFDMEDYDKRHLIMRAFQQVLFDERYRDWSGLGIAVQSYLRNATQDIQQLIDLARKRGCPFTIRLVRGAYWDQETIRAKQQGWPLPVWQSQEQTDQSYEQNLQRLMQCAPIVRTAIATHNPRSLALALAQIEELSLDTDHYEFQMLYGMQAEIQQALASLNQPLRIYVPFGRPIPGMAYLVRRLLENASSQSLGRMQSAQSAFADLDFSPPTRPLPTGSVEEPLKQPARFTNHPTHRFTEFIERQTYQQCIEQATLTPQRHTDLLINGVWTEGEQLLESFNPAQPDQCLGHVTTASAHHVDQAIAAAKTAFPGWAVLSVTQRAGFLRQAAEKLVEQRDEFAALQILEAGKPWAEADADVCEAIDFLNFYADEAERLAEGRQINLPGEANHATYRPLGLGVVIPPWNFPLAILVGMLSATLVSGNCALLKPASDTPLTAARFAELLHGLGLPPGVFAFLPGAGERVGEYLVAHPDINLVAFTGSLSVGQRILAQSTHLTDGQSHFKQVIAELGGKNAVIVDASADSDEAISGILQSAFGFSGQKCSACSRVIVVGDQYSGFVQRLTEAIESLKMGDPTDPNNDLGPVINLKAVQRIHKAIAEGKQHGKLRYQADTTPLSTGHYVGPCLFYDVDPYSPLAQDEIFGPVLSVMPAHSFDQALLIANATRFGLTGGVYSRSPANLQRAREQFDVGNLYLNRGITGALVARQPFGGYRLSGTGSKAGGPDYLQRFMRSQVTTENTMRRGFAP